MVKSKVKTGTICAVSAILGFVINQYPGQLKISEDGLKLIGNFESCRNESYYCPAHVLTAGIGHTGSDVIVGKKYSNEEIAKMWVSDIKEAESCVDKNLTITPTQHQYDAYVSFAFNKGCGIFVKSSVLRLANNGMKKASCEYMRKYIYAGKQILGGLVKRANAEADLCLKED